MKALPMDAALRVRLRELLEVDPISLSELRWGVSCGKARAGSPAGCRRPDGYWQVKIDGKGYLAHRLVWAMTHDEDPGDRQIDHVDGNRGHNDPANLRLATNGENCHNKRRCTNTSGHKGVTRRSDCTSWMGRVKVYGKLITKNFADSKYGGREAALAAAVEWVRATREELHGEFARHA